MRRSDRVGDQIRSELSDLLLREVKDPRVRLASITSVDVSGDLSHAKVLVSVLGAEENREPAVQALEHARGFLRSQLARRLKLRIVPELHFKLDRGAEYSRQIEDLLERLEDDREPA
jgi:ribosome-binding factor A